MKKESKKESKEFKEEWQTLDVYKEIKFEVGDRLRLQVFKSDSLLDSSGGFSSGSTSTNLVYIGYVVKIVPEKNIVSHFIAFFQYNLSKIDTDFEKIERVEQPFIITFESNGFSYKNTENGVETYQSFHAGENIFNLCAAERTIGEFGQKIKEEMEMLAKQFDEKQNWEKQDF